MFGYFHDIGCRLLVVGCRVGPSYFQRILYFLFWRATGVPPLFLILNYIAPLSGFPLYLLWPTLHCGHKRIPLQSFTRCYASLGVHHSTFDVRLLTFDISQFNQQYSDSTISSPLRSKLHGVSHNQSLGLLLFFPIRNTCSRDFQNNNQIQMTPATSPYFLLR